MGSGLENNVNKITVTKVFSKALYGLCKLPFVDNLLLRGTSTQLKVSPCKSWGPDLFIKNFNEYTIPGKGIVYKIKLDEISLYLEDENQSSWVLADLHAFNWIGHIGVIANKNARKIVKEQINYWIKNFQDVKGIAWSPIVVAKRVYHWLNCYFVVKSSEKELLDEFVESLHRQAKFLYFIRGLYSDLEWISTVYKALLLYSISAGNEAMFIKLAKEIGALLADIECNFDNMSSVEMVTMLGDLLDLKSILGIENQALNELIKKFRNMISVVNSDAGLGSFGSNYTPTRQFVNTLLGAIDEPILPDLERFYKASAFNSNLIIDQKDPFFLFNFNFANQMADISNFVKFMSLDGGGLVEKEIMRATKNEDRGFFLFSGNSRFRYDNGDVLFSRRLYLNNLGTELRGEDIISSMTSGSFVNEFTVTDGVKVSNLAYQNGLSIEFLSGKKWIMLLGDNIELTSTQVTGKIVNGMETNVTLIRLESYKTADKDCVFKWSLKEV